MNPEEELAHLRAEVEALRKENAKLKAQGRVDRAAVHLQAGAPAPVESPAGQALAAAGTGTRAGNKHPEVVEALKVAAQDKNAVDADLATATAWVGAAFMKVGHRFASGGMRDRDVPHKPGHTNMNLGGGTITIKQMEICLAELAKDCSGVLEMYDPYKNYGWQSGDPNDIAFGIKEPKVFPELKVSVCACVCTRMRAYVKELLVPLSFSYTTDNSSWRTGQDCGPRWRRHSQRPFRAVPAANASFWRRARSELPRRS